VSLRTKKTKTKTKTQQKVKKLGTNSKRKQKGGVLINEDTVREFPIEECPVCYEKWDDETKNIIPFQIDECKHEICTTCAEQWFVHSKKNSCPSCKKNINIEVVKEQLGIEDQLHEVFEDIRNNNLNKIKTYVEQGGDIHMIRDPTEDHTEDRDLFFGPYTGYNPLQYACVKNKPEIVKYLVDKGANVNSQDEVGSTPLHYSAESSLEIVKYLVNKGAYVNAQNNNDETPLHLAIEKTSLEIVKYLVDKGADVNTKNEEGLTPLHYACSYGTLEIVKYLVEKKNADVNSQDYDDFTPLHIAVSKNSLEIVKYLVDKGADINSKNNENKTPLDIARIKGNNEIVDFLTNINRGGGKFRKTKKR